MALAYGTHLTWIDRIRFGLYVRINMCIVSVYTLSHSHSLNICIFIIAILLFLFASFSPSHHRTNSGKKSTALSVDKDA